VNRVLFDMDNVLVDFDGYARQRGLSGQVVKALPGAYRAMAPLPGALDAVRTVESMGYEVWIASKPPQGIAHAYAEKADWVHEHLPQLSGRLILTPDKGLLGDEGDVLIDDRPHAANCHEFRGLLIPFSPGTTWADVFRILRAHRPQRRIPSADRPLLRRRTASTT